jgi:hypothetical protein
MYEYRPTILNLGIGWTPWGTVFGTHCVAGSVRIGAGTDAVEKRNIFIPFSPIELRFLDVLHPEVYILSHFKLSEHNRKISYRRRVCSFQHT